MSNDVVVYLSKKNMPTSLEWGERIFREFGIKQFDDFDLKFFSGFLPSGDSCGFDYMARFITEEESAEYELGDFKFDLVITLSTKTEREFLVALCSIAALALISKGMVCDPQKGAIYTAEEAFQLANNYRAARAPG